MANYYASARTNYFRVKDEAKFREAVAKLGPNIDIWQQNDDPAMFGLGFDETGVPCSMQTANEDDWEDLDFAAFLAEHLQDDQVAVVIEAGAEKMRYIIGQAFAVNAEGEVVFVDLSEIYHKAKAQFGIEPTRAEY